MGKLVFPKSSVLAILLDPRVKFLPNSRSLRGSESGGGSFPGWVLCLFRTLATSESNPAGTERKNHEITDSAKTDNAAVSHRARIRLPSWIRSSFRPY